MPKTRSGALSGLPSFDDEGNVRAIVEATRGSRNKFKYDPDARIFALDSVLPAGATVPFDFGFIPSTKGEDGDPIDIL